MKSFVHRPKNGFWRCVAPCLSLAMVVACAEQVQQGAEAFNNFTANLTDASRSSAITEVYHGPKARVAVSRFEVKRGVPADLSDGLAGMLRAALAESGRFAPIEPLEQEDLVALKGGSSVQFVKESTAVAGDRFSSPDLLVFGEVAEFDEGTSGNKATFLGNSEIGRWLGNTVLDVKSSHIAINLRLVDAHTTDIVASKVVTRKTSDVSNLSFAGGELGFGLQGYATSPMGQAIRLAVEDATRFLIEATPPRYFQPQ
jgi:curli biogenesis system outer membrane secretion channel CsgG